MTEHTAFEANHVVGPLPWPDHSALPSAMTLPELIEDIAHRTPQAPALVAGDVRLSYSELAEKIRAFAASLADLGVGRGSRVAVLGPNISEWMIAVYGAMRLGARVDAFNTWVRAWDLEHLLAVSEAEVVVTVSSARKADILAEFAQLLPELWDAPVGGAVHSLRFPELRHLIVIGDGSAGTPVPAVAWLFNELLSTPDEWPTPACAAQADDPAFVLYTSGSTQKPKAVPLTHRALIENAYAIGLRMGIGADDRIWLGSPLFWSFGVANVAGVAITHGACLVLQEAFTPDSAADVLAAEQCSAIYLLPSMADALAAQVPEKISAIDSLRTGLTIGRPDEIQRIVSDLNIPEICNIYGSTETYGNCCVTSHSDSLEVRLTTQGPPLPGVMLRVVDLENGETLGPNTPGELQVRGRITPGYLDNDEANAAAFTSDGWFRTGDTVSIDDAGYVQFHSRHTDMIKTSGINVSPAEVETFISTHPAVAEVAVVGADHPSRGEVVVAFVVAEPGSTLDGDEIRTFCRSGMASYKAPWVVEVVLELPRTQTGKMVRKDLRTHACEAVDRAVHAAAASGSAHGH
ncbi:class I adenylate-forming enzyme family protein [Rhodococcus sp. T7]|uniref:class I adenylate-forming enzyme family protein n=1 Tax=Rhodococcus sp. T7 TaxID=627444 RepID=UPI0013CA7934|nr:class I adenylate-forming enzyme family protein [Rhodococcus sp. T7]KAF0957187.1 3-[(3aS,4S,7aS)-7a-methyl-1,5-dioxo-octahydro-1H-inden-4-yl]propanoyl:CoA ligase [Rhodococcus sp. T7]KAF0959025.1 3-[(3aS,4S,7aS)-7a-methyl-1,5-dioxo-octahydro-1H-inden-4-yl]propanoyl:CoA ligase [Rhodococcus sp. T7]